MRAPRFAFDQIENGLAVADGLTNNVTLLNASAAMVWLALHADRHSAHGLEAEIAGFRHPGLAITGSDMEPVLRAFQDLGWVTCNDANIWHLHDTMTLSPDSDQTARDQSPLATRCSHHELLWQHSVRLSYDNVTLEIWGPSDIRHRDDIRRLSGFLSGLPESPNSGRQSTLSMAVESDGITVTFNGQNRVFADLNSASALFNLSAIKLAYPDYTARTILHAAAVCRPSGAIIFPAVSGSGKTTLTAYLAAKGWHYGGDDIIGLGRDRSSGRTVLLPFPTALGIKDGAVKILTRYYPMLEKTPAVTYGNKTARFVGVDAAQLVPDTGEWRKPAALIFPNYDPSAHCELTALPEWNALELLLTAGTGTGLGTDFDSFGLLTELIKTVPRFRLRYSSLEDAAIQLENLP